MTSELISHEAFRWFMTIMTGGVAGTWGTIDAFRFMRMMKKDGRDPVVRDKRFGYAIGVAVGAVGVIGCLRFHGVM